MYLFDVGYLVGFVVCIGVLFVGFVDVGVG